MSPQVRGNRRQVRLHGLEGLLVDGAESLELGLGALDGAFAPEPHRDRESLVGALECYLAAQDSAARDCYVLDLHDFILFVLDLLYASTERVQGRVAARSLESFFFRTVYSMHHCFADILFPRI